jgi:hypothetical protein
MILVSRIIKSFADNLLKQKNSDILNLNDVVAVFKQHISKYLFCLISVLDHIRNLKEESEKMISRATIDIVSLYYEFIIKFLTKIGGDLEKKLPCLDFEERKTEKEKTIHKNKEETGDLDETFHRLKTQFGSTKDWRSKLQQHINEALMQDRLTEKIVASFFDEILETEVETISPQIGSLYFYVKTL